MTVRTLARAAWIPFVLMSFGCADDEPQVAATTSALSPSSCANATADVTFNGPLTSPWISPRDYNTCYKAYVADFFTTWPPQPIVQITAAYGDIHPTTQATCEGTTGRVIWYYSGVDSYSDWQVKMDDESATGKWVADPPPPGFPPKYYCALPMFAPSLAWLPARYPNDNMRMAATFRDLWGNTRKIKISTAPCSSFYCPPQ